MSFPEAEGILLLRIKRLGVLEKVRLDVNQNRGLSTPLACNLASNIAVALRDKGAILPQIVSAILAEVGCAHIAILQAQFGAGQTRRQVHINVGHRVGVAAAGLKGIQPG